MNKRHYNEYFKVPASYTANMTREAINETPDKWLDFYPHAKYLEFLNTLFDEAKSVWLTGNFGTGKSNAALVTHKLFMDDKQRVDKWFEDYSKVIPNGDSLKKRLLEEREKGILVVYDYNASGIGPNEEFLVRLEKGILSALKDCGYVVPAKANLELVIERLRREGENFFKIRDEMLGEMKSLKSDIHTTDQLVSRLQEESNSSTPTHYLEDVQAVFHRDSIYLNIDVSTFREWIASICEANHLKRVIYIFDEFSEFIDSNSGTLKTFEDVTEAPATNHFYLVPVTHKELDAFYGENSPGANKAKDRFYFRNLQMPNDIAFRLAKHAMKEVEEEPFRSEWKEAKDILWNSIVTVVDKFNDPETSEAYVSRQSFYDILPIQPMAAFLLKFLAESARSNQRSIFEYLKGSADGREFQEFIAKGGPLITNRQFLTVDYLWKYFMEREDSGQSKEISAVKMEYDRIRQREFIQYDDDQAEIRVLKTVMLFTLLSRLNPNGHDRLRPTVENIELSFRGDGVVVDVGGILRDLADNRHCFSIVNGNIDLYATTVGNDDLEKKKKELFSQFYELLSDKCKTEIEKQTKSIRGGFSGGRFEIRVSDVNHTTLTNIVASTRDKFSLNLSKDDGSICLWFVVAKNKSEQMQIQGKQETLLRNLRGHRIIMLAFPEVTFCEKNVSLWDEYVTLHAQYQLENNTTAKEQIQKSYVRIEDAWTNSLKSPNTAINVCYYDTDKDIIDSRKCSWTELKSFLVSYMKSVMDCCPDIITDQITVFNNKGLKGWALSGIRFSGVAQQAQLINSLKTQGITAEDSWFFGNPNHLFSKIRALLQKKYDNTAGRGTNFSIRKAYIELQRAPYGMRYNCLSAFTLGLCMRWVLQNNCQWTNGQLSQTLDEETLAEIIEATVSGKTDKEKFICRLSKEDKAFAQRAVCMFGLPQGDELMPMETLRQIAANVEANSYKVPLWVLAEYIRQIAPEEQNMADILDKLCIALRISSKGNTEERSAAITEIGAEILKCPDIIGAVAKYTKPDVYITAFQQYVDKADASLMELASKVEDYSHVYCDMILGKAATTAGWLWNKFDISALIEQVNYSYRMMELARSFLRLTGYASYEDILVRLSDKLANSGLPYAFVEEKYSPVAQLINELQGGRDARKLYEALHDSFSIMNTLYNDPEKKKAVEMVREHIGDGKIDDAGLRTILGDLSGDANFSIHMTIEEYVKLIRIQVEKNVRNTIIGNITREWKRISGFDTISDWSMESKLPAWTVFTDVENRIEMVGILRNPENYANEALEQKLADMEIIPVVSIRRCQEVFLDCVVPRKYKKLNIEIGALLKYLEDSKGGEKDPNEWPEHPDIDEFIKEQYKEVFAPDVLNRIRNENAEDLKNKILKLAKVDPDIGLRFLE